MVRARSARLALVLPAVLAALCAGGRGASAAGLEAIELAARKEGEVTWYVASIDKYNAEAAGNAFAVQYGIKANVVQAQTQVMFQRLTHDLSQNARKADVFSSVDIGNFVKLKEQGALMAYKPENAAKLLPAFQNLDKEGMFHATTASVIAIAYNIRALTADEAPDNWTRLLDPRWTNKIALVHPAFSVFAGNWAAQMNKQYGRPYFYRLAELKPHISRSPVEAINLVASGERHVAVVPIAPAMEQADQGKPLAVRYPTDGSILVTTPSAILKSAPHPNAAKLLVEFLMGPKFGALQVRRRFEAMRADVKPLSGTEPLTNINLRRPTVDEATKGIVQAAEVWRGAFGK
jgi:iron(III) transport system substrate-binding protein